MTFVNQFNSKADILMEKFRKYSDGKTQVELLKEFNKATLDAIAQVKNILIKILFDKLNKKLICQSRLHLD
jgi:hypothetical protein